MAAFTGNGYLVPDITALLAIGASDRPAFKVLLEVAGIGWHEYDNTATTGGLTPADNPATGRWFPISREVLRANRTYYVRTDGSDSNTGLTNTSGGAFLTLPKAIDVVSALDLSIYTLTIQLGDGTYSLGSGYLDLKSFIGSGRIVIQGNVSNPSAVTLTGTNANGVVQSYNVRGIYSFRYLTFTNTGNGHAINCQGSTIHHGNCRLGSLGSGWGFVCANNGLVTNALDATGYPLDIVGDMSGYFLLFGAGITEFVNATITASGSPTFASAGIACYGLSYVNTYGMVVSGSATGKRYDVSTNSVIASAGTTYLGSTAGTTATGGLFT